MNPLNEYMSLLKATNLTRNLLNYDLSYKINEFQEPRILLDFLIKINEVYKEAIGLVDCLIKVHDFHKEHIIFCYEKTKTRQAMRT